MEKFKGKMKKRYSLISAGIFVLFLIAFEILAQSSQRISFLFGSPSLIFQSFIKFTIDGTLLYDTFLTGFETIAGFIIGTLLGTFIGFLLWYSPKVAKISHPYIFILGVIPIFAFAPIVIVWLGIGIVMKIALSAFGVFLVALTQAYDGARSIPEDEFKLMKVYGATRKQLLNKVIFPASLSWVFASLRMNIGFALLGAIIGEFIAAQRGLGHFMFLSGSFYDIPAIFAGGIYLVFLALILNFLVGLIEKNKMKVIEKVSIDRKMKRLILENR